MEADRPPAEIPSLEDVRARFIEAEDHLQRVAVQIEAASKAGAELRQSRESLTAAAEALIALATEIGKTASGFADHDAALRRAIDLLAAADPAAIREDVALLRAIAAENREAAARQVDTLAQSLGEQHQEEAARADEVRVRLDVLRGQSTITVALAALTLVGVVALLILSRL